MTKTFITLVALTLLLFGGPAGAQDPAPMDADRAAEQARAAAAQDAESRAEFRSIDEDVFYFYFWKILTNFFEHFIP